MVYILSAGDPRVYADHFRISKLKTYNTEPMKKYWRTREREHHPQTQEKASNLKMIFKKVF